MAALPAWTFLVVLLATAAPSASSAPSKRRAPWHTFQKCSPWLPWVLSGCLMLLSVGLCVVIVVILQRSPKKELLQRLLQNSTDWHCRLKSPGGKEQEFSCCKEGWKQFGSSCYYLSADTSGWSNSRKKCTKMASDLVVINSHAEQEFLVNYIKVKTDVENFFIGLTDQEQKNQWRWVDQTPLNPAAEFWRVQEPSKDGDEYCVVMYTRNTGIMKNWNNVKCDSGTHHYICESMKAIF